MNVVIGTELEGLIAEAAAAARLEPNEWIADRLRSLAIVEIREAAEVWKSCASFEWYEVSNLGRVRNVRPKKWGPRPNGGLLIPFEDSHGYLEVDLYDGQRARKRRVHRLVAEAFIGPSPGPKYEVNHKDRNRPHNAVENLEWMTHTENMHHWKTVDPF